jgi:hypothetical protein
MDVSGSQIILTHIVYSFTATAQNQIKINKMKGKYGDVCTKCG